MKTHVIRQLKSRTGSSLAEMLVVLLIMSLVTSGIAGGATVVQRVYREVRLKADAQTLLSTTIDAINADLYQVTKVAVDPSSSGNGESVLLLYSGTKNYWFKLVNDESAGTIKKFVGKSKSALLDFDPDASNASGQNLPTDLGPVVTTKTRTLNLTVTFIGNGIKAHYTDAGELQYLSYTVEVKSGEKQIESQDINVEPVKI